MIDKKFILYCLESISMVVFTDSFFILNGEEVTTDFGRTEARITGGFSIPLDPGQNITETLLFMQVRRIGGFSDGRIQAFLNGVKIWDQKASFGRTTAFEFDSSINRDLIMTDGSTNILEFRFFQGFPDGLNRWQATAQLTYNGNTEREPTEPPEVEPPIIDTDPSEGESPPFFEPGSFADILFGNADRVIRTVVIAGVIVAGVFIIPPVARSITATQKLRKKTSRSAV